MILLATLCATMAFGQELSDIPKKTNTIILSDSAKSFNYLIEFANYLQDQGYDIEKLDKDLQNLNTAFKDYKFAGLAQMKIYAFTRQMDSTAVLTIKCKILISSFAGQAPMDACNCGIIGDARLNAFKETLRLAKGFQYDKIEFLIK